LRRPKKGKSVTSSLRDDGVLCSLKNDVGVWLGDCVQSHSSHWLAIPAFECSQATRHVENHIPSVDIVVADEQVSNQRIKRKRSGTELQKGALSTT
jgi:hypothetical protein